MERDSVIFYRSFYEALNELGDADRLACYDAILAYGLYGIEPTLNGVPSAVFKLIRPKVDRWNHFLEGQNGRRSAEYVEWRKRVFERDDYTCALCGRRGGKLNAHHIKPYSKFSGLRYEIGNGVTLCEKCHKEVHRHE